MCVCMCDIHSIIRIYNNIHTNTLQNIVKYCVIKKKICHQYFKKRQQQQQKKRRKEIVQEIFHS